MFRPVTNDGAPSRPGKEPDVKSRLGDHLWDEEDAEAEALLRIVNILEKTTAMGADIIDNPMKGRILWYLNHRYAMQLALVSDED